MNVLKQGSRGGDVKVLQKYLNLNQDGVFGLRTTMTVKNFQKSKGLKADGIVGNKTWLKLIEDDLKNNKVTDADMIKAAVELNIELAVIKAVRDVESCGKAIQLGVPTMLFEGHVFWKELKNRKIDPEKHVKGNEDILYKSWTKKYYTGSNQGEYKRLQRAILINEEAAYASASYGMFQIMGNNYKVCGYKTAKDFFIDLSKREDAHFESFINFIKWKKLIPYMQQKNWAKIAYYYNGSGYKQNKYDQKLENAYNKYK